MACQDVKKAVRKSAISNPVRFSPPSFYSGGTDFLASFAVALRLPIRPLFAGWLAKT